MSIFFLLCCYIEDLPAVIKQILLGMCRQRIGPLICLASGRKMVSLRAMQCVTHGSLRLWTQKLMLLHDRWGIRKGIVHKMLNSTMCYQLFQAFRRVCWSVKEMRFYFTFCWGWQVCSSGAVYLKSQGVTDSRHTVS